MANNRMYLVHIPTGKQIKLGSRSGGPLYGKLPNNHDLEAFFHDCANAWNETGEGGWDDYRLEFEVGQNPGF